MTRGPAPVATQARAMWEPEAARAPRISVTYTTHMRVGGPVASIAHAVRRVCLFVKSKKCGALNIPNVFMYRIIPCTLMWRHGRGNGAAPARHAVSRGSGQMAGRTLVTWPVYRRAFARPGQAARTARQATRRPSRQTGAPHDFPRRPQRPWAVHLHGSHLVMCVIMWTYHCVPATRRESCRTAH